MMVLSEREKWLFVLTVMKTSKRAKDLPIELKQEICEFIRKREAPSINHDEWLKMEYDIRDTKDKVMILLQQGMSMAIGEGDKLPPEVRKMFSEEEFAKLENVSRKSDLLKDLNSGDLIKDLDKLDKPELEKIKATILEYLREKDENQS